MWSVCVTQSFYVNLYDIPIHIIKLATPLYQETWESRTNWSPCNSCWLACSSVSNSSSFSSVELSSFSYDRSETLLLIKRTQTKGDSRPITSGDHTWSSISWTSGTIGFGVNKRAVTVFSGSFRNSSGLYLNNKTHTWS